MTNHYHHKPVLLTEVLEHLAIKPYGFYIDATFGRGGHAREILHKLAGTGFLLAIDKDPDAVAGVPKEMREQPNFKIVHGSFSTVYEIAKAHNVVGKVNGILLDLGVSSPQLDNPEKGFSFLHAGPLDMRMDPTQGISAAEWLAFAKEDEIALVLKEYGEERFAKRIANAIVRERAIEPISSTDRLAKIVKEANPSWERTKHPATRSFQAIRIFINNELNELRDCLTQSMEILATNGRMCVISFHSLEDRIVKRFIRDQSEGLKLPKSLPIKEAQMSKMGRHLRKIAMVKPTEIEIRENPRARSAILRVAEKIV
jgi:16S rRNA (cytosine1402-N4)-methyltransferase